MLGFIAFAAFAGTIPIANWMIGNVGTTCVPGGPCLVPVGFGLMAPSAVLVIGAALVLRDAVHRLLGAWWAVAAILIGAALSGVLAPPALVVASLTAFLLSEFADLVIYAPLARRRLVLAVLLSGVVGSVVDSLVFLSLAFGSLEYLQGQVLGKVWASVAAAGVLWLLTHARATERTA